jgi:hypothetical protein
VREDLQALGATSASSGVEIEAMVKSELCGESLVLYLVSVFVSLFPTVVFLGLRACLPARSLVLLIVLVFRVLHIAHACSCSCHFFFS